jgi:hypothetical protein
MLNYVDISPELEMKGVEDVDSQDNPTLEEGPF